MSDETKARDSMWPEFCGTPCVLLKGHDGTCWDGTKTACPTCGGRGMASDPKARTSAEATASDTTGSKALGTCGSRGDDFHDGREPHALGRCCVNWTAITTGSKAARQMTCERIQRIYLEIQQQSAKHDGHYPCVCDLLAAALDAKDAEIEAAREQEREAWRSLAVTGCDIHRNVAGALHAAGGMPGCPACHRRANAENVVLKANASTHDAALRALQASHAEDLRVAVEQAWEERDRDWRRVLGGDGPSEYDTGHYVYAHMCRDGHPTIGHNDSGEDEMCPLCRALADVRAAHERGYAAGWTKADAEADGLRAEVKRLTAETQARTTIDATASGPDADDPNKTHIDPAAQQT